MSLSIKQLLNLALISSKSLLDVVTYTYLQIFALLHLADLILQSKILSCEILYLHRCLYKPILIKRILHLEPLDIIDQLLFDFLNSRFIFIEFVVILLLLLYFGNDIEMLIQCNLVDLLLQGDLYRIPLIILLSVLSHGSIEFTG